MAAESSLDWPSATAGAGEGEGLKDDAVEGVASGIDGLMWVVSLGSGACMGASELLGMFSRSRLLNKLSPEVEGIMSRRLMRAVLDLGRKGLFDIL